MPGPELESKVGVVVPVRNGRPTVRRAVTSALGCTVVDQVVVVDDGSVDGTAQALEDIDDKRLSVLRQPPTGVAAARNLGASAIDAEWLVFLDADDVLVERGVGALVADLPPEVVLVCADSERIDGSGCGSAEITSPVLVGPIVRPLLAGSFAVRRQAFLDIGGYDVSLGFSENTDLSIRLLRDRSSDAVALRQGVALRRTDDIARRRPSEYSERILAAADHFLTVHAAVLAGIGATAEYASTAGVAAARLRRWPRARQLFLEALRGRGRRWSDGARLLVTFVPGVRDRVWPS